MGAGLSAPEQAAMLLSVCPSATHALHRAAELGAQEVYQLICTRAPPGAPLLNELGEPPLFTAIRARRTDMALWLLARDPGAARCSGYHKKTALHRAAARNMVAVVHALLDAGAAIDAAADFSETPLHRAVLRGATAAAVALSARGADHQRRITFCRADNRTPFEFAVILGHATILQQFLTTERDPAVITEALHLAHHFSDCLNRPYATNRLLTAALNRAA